MLACTNARLVATGGGVLGDVTPNFIVADWTQKHGNIVGDVRNFNWQILLQNGFPIGASGGLASDMTLTGIE
jgi:hypothetical protein